ncbi:hypothetical protein ACTFIY_011937 [Dictyostelium cf. discoideum]
MRLESISSLSCGELCKHLKSSLGDEYSKIIERFKKNEISDYERVDNKIYSLIKLVEQMKATNTKVPTNNFSNISSTTQQVLLNPSPQSKIVKVVDSTSVDANSIPIIISEVLSLYDASLLPNLPKGRGEPVSLPSTCDGPSDNVVFYQVYDESKKCIAILPNVQDPYDVSSYGKYSVTIFDESGEREVLKSLVNVNPPETIILPKKFIFKTPLGETIDGTVDLMCGGLKAFFGSITHGGVDLPQNLLDGTYDVIFKPNKSNLLPLMFQMIIHDSVRTTSSHQMVNRLNKPDEMDFILVWGQTPRDLDSHIWCIHPNGSIDHVYFGSKKVGKMNLDVDKTKGYGPETIRFKPLNGFTYFYAVHNYSDEAELAQSGAKLRINSNASTSLERSFWIVCTIDGTSRDIDFKDRFGFHDVGVHIPFKYDKLIKCTASTSLTRCIPNTQQKGARFWIVCTVDGTSGDIVFKDHFEFHNVPSDIPLKYK